jgi:hypothetical protein
MAPQQPADASAPAAPNVTNEQDRAEELQHGRKFTAKRRTLPENGEAEAPNGGTEVPMPPVSENAPDMNVQNDDSGDIQFGRGRR